MDEIRIERLRLYAHHGYFADEKWNGQYFEVSVVLKLPLQDAGVSDAIANTVDYAAVCEYIAAKMTEKTFDLIESVAEFLADSLMDQYEAVREAEVEVRKPDAPISMEVSYVSVKVTRQRHRAYVAFGSNLGDSRALIQQAVDLVDQDRRCKVLEVSPIRKSTPYGGVEQADYYNGVMEVETYYEPLMFLKCLQEIEIKLGRKRKVRWGPRTMDLDILLFDRMVIDSKELIVPHPDMQNRDFVLLPLSEIAPYLRHPLLHKTIGELLEDVKESHMEMPSETKGGYKASQGGYVVEHKDLPEEAKTQHNGNEASMVGSSTMGNPQSNESYVYRGKSKNILTKKY